MRTSGILILCGFAAIWGALALNLLGLPWVVQLAPVAVSVVVATMTLAMWRNTPTRSADLARRAKQAVMIWSAVEGVAIFIAVNVLANLHHSEWVVPAIAIIVGLHFYPLASALRTPPYWVTGTLMVAFGVVAITGMALGILQQASFAAALAAGASAVVLWLTSLLMKIGVKPDVAVA